MIARFKRFVLGKMVNCSVFQVRRRSRIDIHGHPQFVSSSSFAIAIFRVAVGVLGGIYFADQLATIDLYVGEGQLIPTSSIQSFFDHSRPIISDLASNVIHGEHGEHVESSDYVHANLNAMWSIGLLACLAMIWDVFPRIFSLLGFIATVASSAWTYPLTYVDDSVMALSFFWVALLPEKIDRRSSAEVHAQELAIRVITYHVGVLYFLSGLWKLASPMWRQGDALSAILMMPGSRFSEFWQSHPSSILPILNDAVVAVEIALPIFLLSSTRRWRFFGVGMQCMLHAGIAALMYVPYANLALAASSVLFLRIDLDRVFQSRNPSSMLELKSPPAKNMGRVTQWERILRAVYRPFFVLYLMVILSAGLGELPGLRVLRIHRISQSFLNAVGLNHGFRLFDWIDSRAFVPHWQLSWEDRQGGKHQVHLQTIVPESMRSAIFSTYFVGQPWIDPSPQKRTLWQRQLAQQFNRRFCQKFANAVAISADVQALRFALDGVFKADDAHYTVADRLPCSRFADR